MLPILVTLAGCAPKAAPQSQSTAPPVSLTIAAAASLSGVLKDVDSLYTQGKPNVTVTPIFAGSGALQQQIENSGSAIDVFISAGAKQMDSLQKEQLLLGGARKNLLGNKLVLIVPNDSALGITDFMDLAGAKVKHVAIGDPKSVPAGQYAEMVFKEDKIADQIKTKEVIENDVRGVLSAVESGNADAGIVYITDAMTSTKVKVVANAPDDINAQIVYPVAVISASKNANAAEDYVTFLSTEQAQAVFEKYGFIVK
jgi:molybdate transport system substrate-binding protein